MPNVNVVLVAGHLTRDPKTNETKTSAKVCNFTVAVNRYYKTKEGKRIEEVTFVDCEAWAQQSDVVTTYCKKGSPIMVQGRLKLNSWEAEDGKKRSRLVIVAERIQLLGTKGDAASKTTGEDVPF